MSLSIASSGMMKLLDKLMIAYGSTLIMALYANYVSPNYGTVLSDFVEANFTGYGRQTVGPWGASALSGGVAIAHAPDVTYRVTSAGIANNIFGYFLLDGAGNLLWAELDPTYPAPMNIPGDTYTITPTFSLGSVY